MQARFGHLTGVAAALMLITSVVPAHAIGVKASLSGGVVNVSGSQAAKSALISWEGVVVTTSGKGGSFAFSTTIVPTDCIGTLNDGTSSVDVRIDGCSDVSTGLP